VRDREKERKKAKSGNNARSAQEAFEARISKSIAIGVTGCSRNLNTSLSSSFYPGERYERERCDRFYVNLDVNSACKSNHPWCSTTVIDSQITATFLRIRRSVIYHVIPRDIIFS